MTGDIQVRALTKTFRSTTRRPGALGTLRSLFNPIWVTKTAVEDITFSVAPGELLALLGPNGAGKSTIIKMLTGILTPTAGEARVAGVVPYEERERNARNIGAVFGQRTQLWWDLPVRESFAILRDIYDVPADEHAARLREFDELLDLSSFWDTRVRHLSLGQRVRSDLAAALLHDPPVVFLDEPTIGMDVVVKEQVREFLRYQVEERGRTVLLTTHDMTEVERLAERVVLINHGRLVLDGTLDEIRRKFGSTWQVRATLADAHALVEPWAGVVLVRREGPQVVFGPDGPAAPTVHQALKQVIERYEVTDIALDEAELEDVMRAAYVQAGDTAADVAAAQAQGG
ncbi:ATP-binding cassette domain-containing protein [Streptomyces xiangluensis]|uniref:ATP-binding cassette domain-containing protein n=1 Tax=Streptomyces xiangluensis TaxID=2665720 RepID=A0ABV8Z025_9ACTN